MDGPLPPRSARPGWGRYSLAFRGPRAPGFDTAGGAPDFVSARRGRSEPGSRPQVYGRRRPTLCVDAVLPGRIGPHAAGGRTPLHPHDRGVRRRLTRRRTAHDPAWGQTDSGVGICHVGGGLVLVAWLMPQKDALV